jgi:hypothetical protein
VSEPVVPDGLKPAFAARRLSNVFDLPSAAELSAMG